MKIFPKIGISLSALFASAFFALFYGFEYLFAVVFATLIHEFGHISVITWLKGTIISVKFRLCGAVIKRSGRDFSYFSEFFVSIGGIAANLITFFISLLLGNVGSFAYANLILALANLVPGEGFDGYCALRALAFSIFGLRVGDIFLSITSTVILVLLWIFALYLIIYHASSIYLLILVTFLICRFVISRKESKSFEGF